MGGFSYLPGDTVNSLNIIYPFTGDADTSDNTEGHTDTVKSGYDPNFIEVSPSGYIPSGMQLQYTVGFENTGNDTAFNIHILDTLADQLDPTTLRIVTASSAMNIYTFHASGHTIVKFDFPNIDLLDSSHHDACHGMMIYTIKSKTGLTDCTHIPAKAGIYFDENPVVMTNTATNIIGIPPPTAAITGNNHVCLTGSVSLTTSFTGGTWSSSNSNATVSSMGVVTGTAFGQAFIKYTIPGVCEPVTSMFLMTIDSIAPIVSLSGANMLCEGADTILTTTTVGGSWTASNSHASVLAGIVTAITAGTVNISYTVTNGCGATTATHTMTINPAPVAGTITGLPTVCEGSMITLTSSVSGGTWAASNSNATISMGSVTGNAAGTVAISYTITNSCGSVTTTHDMTVLAMPVAGSITGASSVCEGSFISLTPTLAGGTWSASNSNATVVSGIVTGISAGIDTIYYSITNTCGMASTQHVVSINSITPAGPITGLTSVCEGVSITLTGASGGGTWSTFNGNATVAGGIVTGVNSGIDTVYYTIASTCGTSTALQVMTIDSILLAGAISGPDSVCIGLSISLSNTVSGGIWSTLNGNVTVTGGVVTGITPGIDSILYTVSSVCGLSTSSWAISIIPEADCNSTAISNTKNTVLLSISPNPATNELTIITDEIENYSSVMITNNIGQTVLQQQLTASKTRLNIANLSSGFYYVIFSGTNGNTVREFVKQ